MTTTKHSTTFSSGCAPFTSLPETNTTGTEMFTITTQEVLITLITELDYEVKQSYTLKLRVTDQGTGLSGHLIVDVGYYILHMYLTVLHFK